MSTSNHAAIARKMWHVYLGKRGTTEGAWAKFNARLHLKLAKEKKNEQDDSSLRSRQV